MTALATFTLTGLALAGIPAGTGAPASPVATALAWLAAVAVVLLLFGAVCAIAACLLSSRTSQAEEAREPLASRPAQANCQHEPPYPSHKTALLSLRAPMLTAHPPSWRCGIEAPHAVTGCGEFATLNPLGPSGATMRTYE